MIMVSKFKKFLNHNWNRLYGISDFQKAFTLFFCYIKESFENNFHKKATHINYKNRNPWMTQEMKTQ